MTNGLSVGLVIPFSKMYRETKNDPGRTRTCNLRFRRPMPYPLGHGASEALRRSIVCVYTAEWNFSMIVPEAIPVL